MADYIILRNNVLVPLSNVSDIDVFNPYNVDLLFFSDGRLRKFIKNNIAYIALFNNLNEFIGYYIEKNFWAFNKNNPKRNISEVERKLLGLPFYFSLPLSEDFLNARVVLAHRDIIINGNVADENVAIKLRTSYKFIPYNIVKPIVEDVNFFYPTDYDLLEVDVASFTSLKPYFIFIVKKKYLGANGLLRELEDGEIDVLADIMYVLDEIFSDIHFTDYLTSKNLIEPFNAHINLPARYSSVIFGQIDPKYHYLYNDEYFALFRLKLIDFRYWLLNYKFDYSQIDINDLSVYIVNIFTIPELSTLSYSFKTNLINNILVNNIWIIGDWAFNKLNEEQAIIKIIRSIANETNGVLNYAEIDSFFDFLGKLYYNSISETLFEILYNSINDTIVLNDDGKGNKGQFVKAVYNLWLESKYNPDHENETIANNAMNLFTYTIETANHEYDDPTIFFPQIDYSKAPYLLGYDSEKFLLWYRDNFTFEFYKNKILAKIDV